MYQNVIVPFDGSLPARAALAPAADLAWRCGARVVIVNNTEASDEASQKVLKSRAMSMSGADVDFWVDLDHSIGRAVVEAARFRDDPIVCISVRVKTVGLRRRPTVGAMAAEVLVDSPSPVLVMGPQTDVSRGLDLSEIVVALDGSPESEQILPVALEWATTLKLRIRLVGVVRNDAGGADAYAAEAAYLRGHVAKLAREVTQADYELIEAVDPASGICAHLADRKASVVAMSTHGRSGPSERPLGGVAQSVLLSSPRPILFRRPRD